MSGNRASSQQESIGPSAQNGRMGKEEHLSEHKGPSKTSEAGTNDGKCSFPQADLTLLPTSNQNADGSSSDRTSHDSARIDSSGAGMPHSNRGIIEMDLTSFQISDACAPAGIAHPFEQHSFVQKDDQSRRHTHLKLAAMPPPHGLSAQGQQGNAENCGIQGVNVIHGSAFGNQSPDDSTLSVTENSNAWQAPGPGNHPNVRHRSSNPFQQLQGSTEVSGATCSGAAAGAAHVSHASRQAHVHHVAGESWGFPGRPSDMQRRHTELDPNSECGLCVEPLAPVNYCETCQCMLCPLCSKSHRHALQSLDAGNTSALMSLHPFPETLPYTVQPAHCARAHTRARFSQVSTLDLGQYGRRMCNLNTWTIRSQRW